MSFMSEHARTSRLRAKFSAIIGGNPWLLAVALIGFSVSFQTIARLATLHHLPGYPVLYPLLIDVGILAMVTESRRAVAAKRSDLAPRLLAWALIGLTLYVNVHGSPPHDWLGRSLHVVAPALWAALLELSRWRELARARAEKGDPIPLARWLVAFRRTAKLKRHMVLWGETSYSRAVSRQAVILYATAVAQADKRIGSGPLWRRRLPVTLRWPLAEGKPPEDVERAIAVSYGVETWQEPAAEWVASALRMLPASVTATAVTVHAPQGTPGQAPGTTPATAPEGRQPERQGKRQPSASDRAKANAKAQRLIVANPAMSLADVAARSGVSERTASRIKGSLPRQLHVAEG
jgi:Protein of unknown function (DUF2637)